MKIRLNNHRGHREPQRGWENITMLSVALCVLCGQSIDHTMTKVGL